MGLIFLRGDSVGQLTPVNHPGEPSDYTDSSGQVWRHVDPQAWRRHGNADLRVYDKVPAGD